MKEYEALYRKYRPTTFNEVVGQDMVLHLLKKVISEKKPAHAYLFSGGRGTGKTSLARIFAKNLGVKAEDLYELDAASNRGIDEVRALRESVQTLPISSPYKVYILDEAHMLTKEAANALLKTLEEPPSHVIFILATTEREKLPETIHSRCQSLFFAEPAVEVIANHIETVAKMEGFTVQKEASLLMAKEAKGSYRDALGILEKVSRFTTDKEIIKEQVQTVLGISDREAVQSLICMAFSGKSLEVEELLYEAKRKQISVTILFDDILDCLRSLLLVRIGAFKGSDLDRTIFTNLNQTIQVPVQSKHVLYLIEKSPLLKLGEEKAWTIVSLLLIDVVSL